MAAGDCRALPGAEFRASAVPARWHAARGGGIGYRRVHQASMITSWAMPVSMV
jgi:hypothetical protein